MAYVKHRGAARLISTGRSVPAAPSAALPAVALGFGLRPCELDYEWPGIEILYALDLGRLLDLGLRVLLGLAMPQLMHPGVQGGADLPRATLLEAFQIDPEPAQQISTAGVSTPKRYQCSRSVRARGLSWRRSVDSGTIFTSTHSVPSFAAREAVAAVRGSAAQGGSRC